MTEGLIPALKMRSKELASAPSCCDRLLGRRRHALARLFTLGIERGVLIRCEDAETGPVLASSLRLEERELDAGGLN